MGVDVTGVLVIGVVSLSPASTLLKKGDVLLSVDTIKVFILYNWN